MVKTSLPGQGHGETVSLGFQTGKEIGFVVHAVCVCV